MSVVVETTLGDITIDLFIKERPRACLNFLKLCKIKYYNYNLFHTISRGFIAQTGDPTGSRNGGESIFSVLEGPLKRYFEAEKNPRIKHTTMGLVSFVGENQMIGSQFFITLGTDLMYLDEQHCVFGEVMEGLDVLELLNEAICDQDNRPYQDVRITHTVVLDDPFPDPKQLRIPSRSPSPSAERMQGGRIAPDEDIDESEGRTAEEVGEIVAEREAKARATILEMVGDIPDAEMAPPENVLFVCKLNPVTTDDDLEIIFSRFGKIKSCEVIRDKKSADSLQYAFVEFHERKSCEEAYFKMDNVLIDDRRIHVDFSQSVAKVRWHGKGRGVTTYDEKGKKSSDTKNDIGNGKYRRTNGDHKNDRQSDRRSLERRSYIIRRERSRSRDRGRRINPDFSQRSEYRDERPKKSETHDRSTDRHYRENYRRDERDDRRTKPRQETRRRSREYEEKHSRQKSSKSKTLKKKYTSSEDSSASEEDVKEKRKHKYKKRDSNSEDDKKRRRKKHKKKKKHGSSSDDS